jgi:hypothetical protein
MDRWIRRIKVCGVAVLLVVSLLSAGHPAISHTDSVPFLLTQPATMQLNDQGGVADALQTGEGRDLMFYAPGNGTDGQTSHLGVWVTPGRSSSSTMTIEEWLAGAAPAQPQTALLAMEVSSESEVIEHE